MRSSRKLLVGAGSFVAILLVVLIALPLLFRDRIVARVKTEVGKSVAARVAWNGVSLSVLRDFPNVTLRVNGLSVAGLAPFAGDTLVAMREARLVLDAGSVVAHLRRGDPIVVREIALVAPRVRLRVLANGLANWDIVRGAGATPDTAGNAIGVTLRDLRITDGDVTLDDAQARLAASLRGIDGTLQGDFADERFVLSTRTRVDSASLDFAGIPYLSRAALSLDAEVDADMKARRFTLRNDSLRINRLVLGFAGSVTLDTPNVALDLTFAAPSTAFGDILSLVPAIYLRGFEELRTSGSMSASGRVRGAYGPRAFPAFSLRASVERGTFQYPSLPLPARDIAMELAIDNPGGHVDSTVLDLKRFHAVIGNRPVDARVIMRTPVSDPDVDLRARGSVDLADVARTVKLPGVRELAGRVAADVALRARVSDVEGRRYERIVASGTATASRVTLRADSLPHAVAMDTLALALTPRAAEVSVLAARIGRSDVRAVASLDNLLGFALRRGDLRGSATLTSTLIALDELRSKEPTTTVIPIPPRVDLAMRATAERVTFGALTASRARGGVRVRNERATLEDFTLETLGGTVAASGYYETTVPARPTFDVALRAATVDIPTAFTSLLTVRTLAPLARWARGTISGTTVMRGALGADMTPVFAALTGTGTVETDRLVMDGAPLLEKLADATRLEQVRKPALGAVRLAFAVADGRVHVKPFVVQAGAVNMTVAGSNALDQSIAYDLALAVPRGALGSAAGGVVARLASQAGAAMGDSTPGQVVQLRAQVTGTVTRPAVRVDFAGMAASVREAAEGAVRQEIAARAAAVRQTADSAVDQARRRARAEADRLVAQAETQAAAIRAEARALAETARQAGEARADSLLARATNPAARMAAKLGTDRLRREAGEQADRIVREADARAEAIMTAAREKAAAMAPPES